MKRLLILVLPALLVAPPAAFALRSAPGDGTLAVRDGDGNLGLRMRGAVIGKVMSGTLRVVVEPDTDCATLEVFGADGQQPAERVVGREVTPVCVFREFPRRGTAAPMRFRFERGAHQFWIEGGRGIALAAVGRGSGFLRGAGLQDGTYSVDGDEFASLPDAGIRIQLGALTP